METTLDPLRTTGGTKPAWSASGVTTIPPWSYASSGPSAASVYALDPSAVATITPSPAVRA